ncbi:RNA polymerase Rpb1, domain 7-domain-containing protein, partial [Pisolithus tinctorius]
MLAKNVQQELTYTSLRTVTAAVEIWYDPDPISTVIEDSIFTLFVESFFAIPDEEIESKLRLQSPWHLWLVLDHARTIDWSLSVVAGSFKMDLSVVWNEDNSRK